MIGKWLLKGLVIIVLILLSIVLTLITINGIHRCYNYIKTTNVSSTPDHLLVDLYASNKNSIPVEASPGMTILIDLGIHNLDTGVYILREKSLLKLKVPEPNEKYQITKGKFAGYIHTIRQSFLQRIPSETEIILVEKKDINDDTVELIIPPHITFDTTLTITIVDIRKMKLANLSSFNCTINSFIFEKNFIGDIFFAMKDGQLGAWW